MEKVKSNSPLVSIEKYRLLQQEPLITTTRFSTAATAATYFSVDVWARAPAHSFLFDDSYRLPFLVITTLRYPSKRKEFCLFVWHQRFVNTTLRYCNSVKTKGVIASLLACLASTIHQHNLTVTPSKRKDIRSFPAKKERIVDIETSVRHE